MMTGVILAGGENKRMGGRNKALLDFNDEKIIDLQLREMRKLCSEIILVTNTPQDFSHLQFCDVKVVVDEIPGKGPLSGMHTAFQLAQETAVWVVGGDQPFISAKAANLQRNVFEQSVGCSVIPQIQGKYQMLHGVYHRDAISSVEELILNEQYRLRGLLRLIRWVEMLESEFIFAGINPLFTQDVDTPDEYRDALKNSRIKSEQRRNCDEYDGIEEKIQIIG